MLLPEVLFKLPLELLIGLLPHQPLQTDHDQVDFGAWVEMREVLVVGDAISIPSLLLLHDPSCDELGQLGVVG